MLIFPNSGPDMKYFFAFLRTQLSTTTTMLLVFAPKVFYFCFFNPTIKFQYLKTSGSHQKKSIYKDIGFICFEPLPPPPNKDIKNKDILLIYLTPSLVPKIRTYEPFVFGFKKPDFAFFSHNFYGVGKSKKKLVKCS